MTLIELLVASVLLLVVMGAVYGIWSGLQNTYAFTSDDMVAQDQARMAMGEMVESIRTGRLPRSGLIPSEAYKAVIPSAQRNSIMVWTDIDRDLKHDLELVRYRVVNRALYRDEANFTTGSQIPSWTSERLVSPNVSNGRNASDPLADKALWLFTYYGADASGDGLDFNADGEVSQPLEIRQVRINLLVDIYAEEAPVTHQLTSMVQPRNLRQY